MFEQKLHILRDREESPSIKTVEQIRELEKVLGECPSFVGIAIFGSQVKGYADELSDIDVDILWDSSQGNISEEVTNPLRALSKDTMERVSFYYRDINLHGGVIKASDIPQIFSLVIGKKIEDYRARVAKKLQHENIEVQNAEVSSIVDYFMEEDRHSMDKLIERRPELAAKREQILVSRSNMWKRRVRRILGVELKNEQDDIDSAQKDVLYEDLADFYTPLAEHNDYEKMPKRLGFGKSKQSGMY